MPAVFDRALFGALTSLGGSQGARHIIARHRDSVRRVSFPGGGLDIDTPDDSAALAALAGSGGSPQREERGARNRTRGDAGEEGGLT